MNVAPQVDDPDDRRRAVETLLGECVQEKVLRAGTGRALEKAEEAYRLSTEPTEIDGPMPQLAAYRLAHLILRSAPKDERLDRAEVLLSKASSDVLGPVPRLFRVAVLIRMKSLASPADTARIERLDRSINAAFAKAEEGIAKLRMHGPTKPQAAVGIQDGLFNLLEMAAYATGKPYEGLEGLGDPLGDLHLSDRSWFLIGSSRQRSKLLYPEEFAFEELDAIGKRFPEAILFRLCENPRWKRAEMSCWDRVSEQNLRLIAGVIAGEQQGRLRRHVVGEYGHEDALRQARSRARKALRQMLNRGKDYDPLPDSQDGGGKVADDLLIFGAVKRNSFLKVPSRDD